MFLLNIAVGSTSWALLFNEEEKAREAFTKATSQPSKVDTFTAATACVIEDDFGQMFTAPIVAIHACMLEDLDKTRLAHIERALHQQLTQMEAQKRWEQHPAHRAMSRGPGVIAPGFGPMGNGAFPRN
jgi:hypothetical protein